MNVHEIITQRIVKRIEEGTAPWQQQWMCADMPANLVTKREYSGVNCFLAFNPYASRWYLTLKQANALGATIKKGEHGHIVVFWQMKERTDLKTKEKKKSFLLKYYTVFNTEQCEGIPADKIPPVASPRVIDAAAEVIAAVKDWAPSAPKVTRMNTNRACYNPRTDEVTLPNAAQFTSAEASYSVAFHELAHASGHKDRLNRKGIVEFDKHGTDQYAFEELVAELCSAFVCGRTGIANDAVIENSASYLKMWASKLKENTRWIVLAGSQASKAADYILTGKINGHDEPKDATEVASA